MKTLALAVATAGLVLTATPAFADAGEPRTQEISVAGLNLATAEGQRMLNQRVDRAARDVCGYDELGVGTRIRSNEARDCVVKARANAKQQVAVMIQNQQRGG